MSLPEPPRPYPVCKLYFEQLSSRMDLLTKQISEHDDYINGNGHPGAKVTNVRLEERLIDISGRLDQMTKIIWFMVGSVLVPPIIAIVIFITQRGVIHIFTP